MLLLTIFSIAYYVGIAESINWSEEYSREIGFFLSGYDVANVKKRGKWILRLKKSVVHWADYFSALLTISRSVVWPGLKFERERSSIDIFRKSENFT